MNKFVSVLIAVSLYALSAHAQYQMEYLTRGVHAVRQDSGNVFVSWRLLGDDPSSIGFNVYRNGVKVNTTPITTSTNYTDSTSSQNNNYSITILLC